MYFISGGIQIKIEGDNLDSVMEPELFVYQETKKGNKVQSVKKYVSVGGRYGRGVGKLIYQFVMFSFVHINKIFKLQNIASIF